MRNTDDSALVNLRQRHDRGLDFGTVDIEAPGNDHVLLPVHDVDVAVFIQVADIPRMVPAMCADFRRRLRHLVIARANQGSADNDLSPLACWKNFAAVVHDGEMHRRGRLATTGQPFRMHSGGSGRQRGGIQEGHQHRRLRLTIGLTEAGTEDRDGLFQLVRRHRRTSQQKNAQARIVKVTHLRVCQQIIERGRRKIDVGDAITLDVAQDVKRVEFWHHDMGRALGTQCEGHHPCSMRQRSRVQADRMIAIAMPVTRSHLGHRPPGQIRDANTFSRTRRAPGRNQSRKPIDVAIGVGPFQLAGAAALLHERFKRWMFAVVTIQTNQAAQRWHTGLDFAYALVKLAVIVQPRHLDIIHVLDIGVNGIAVVDGYPHPARTHDSKHAVHDSAIIMGIDASRFLCAQPFCP